MDPTDKDDDLRAMESIIRQRSSFPRAPKAIGKVVGDLLARRGYARVQAFAVAEDVWRRLAGRLADRSRPGNIRRGKLEVIVADSAALQELTFQKKRLLASLSASLPEQNIKDIKFRIGRIQ